MRATRAAAVAYDSSSVGEIVSEPAMLSKPLAESSGGSSVVTSMSRSSRSRMALAYSVRFSRCRTTVAGIECGRPRAIDFRFEPVAQPFVTRPAAAAARRAAASRRRAACGRPSPQLGVIGDRRRSRPCSDRFAVFTRSLWQVTQYWSSSARWVAAACRLLSTVVGGWIRTASRLAPVGRLGQRVTPAGRATVRQQWR